MENTQQLDKYVLLIFFSTSNDKEIPSQFHQVTPASWMLMRYSKSRRIFSVMICLKRMDVWWVETHEYDLKTSCSKALKAFNRLYFAMSSLRQTNSMKPGFFRNIYIYILHSYLRHRYLRLHHSQPALSPKDLKTDFSKVQSSAVSLETFRQTVVRWRPPLDKEICTHSESTETSLQWSTNP